jgi:hypothetical protein
MENETQQSDALALAEVETTCLCLNVRKMARVLTVANNYDPYGNVTLQAATLQ